MVEGVVKGTHTHNGHNGHKQGSKFHGYSCVIRGPKLCAQFPYPVRFGRSLQTVLSFYACS